LEETPCLKAGVFNLPKIKKIPQVMDALGKYYNSTGRTTLNRMRENPDPFKILISCLISLRTRDETTEKITKDLFAIISTPKEILEMDTKKLEQILYSSGHYKKKAHILKHVSQELLDKYSGKVPDDKETLLSIKFIGPKTANIVLNFAFGKLAIPVDANVHRIVNRLGWVSTKIAEKTEKELEKILPEKYWMEINALSLLHGRTICVPISPKCSICPVSEYCPKIGFKKMR
jgi:endonuclease-3